MPDKLLACAHCGGKALSENNEDWDKTYDPDTYAVIDCNPSEADMFWVECECCQASTRYCGSEEEAIATWNRRASSEPNKVLTLEELRGMDGEPVYIQSGDGDQGWYIVRTGEPIHATVPLGAERVVWIVNDENPDGDGFDTDFINMEYNDPAGHFGLHVLGWRALRRKPTDQERADAKWGDPS